MTSKKVLGAMAAAGLLGWVSAANAQTPSVSTCGYPWCVNQVVVGPSGAVLEWSEIRMWPGLTGATMLWVLYGGPDDEFRADSVTFTGANATGAAMQFPLRQLTPNRFALDNLNSSGLTYTYQLRVYKKGSPPGTAPVTVSGSITNVSK